MTRLATVLCAVLMLLALSTSPIGCAATGTTGTATIEPTLSIALEKTTFLPAEPVWVRIVARNENEQGMRVYNVDPREQYLRFILLSPEGEEVAYRGLVSDRMVPTQVLALGDSVSWEYDLLEAYAWPRPERKAAGLWTLRHLGPGAYTLTAYLQGVGVGSGGPGYGKTHSNTVTFEVVAPEGEEALAFEAYKQAEEVYWNTPSENRGSHLRLPYLEVASRCPASRYARMALLNAARISARYGKRRESREDLRRSLEEYQLVIDRYPGTREAKKAAELASFIPEYLEEFDAGEEERPEKDEE